MTTIFQTSIHFLIEHESNIRLLIYVTVLVLMAIWEYYSIALPYKAKKSTRWINNILLLWTGSLLVHAIIPMTAVTIASIISQQDQGLLNQLPIAVNFILSLLLLDCLIYWQHRLFHRFHLLWRIHSTHHLDPEVDASTAGRFHPIEIVISMVLKIGAIFFLGCTPLAVFLFEILLNGTATFNHSNIKLGNGLKRILRPWLVTPEMHRIHHSSTPIETHSNFGFCLCIWDKLFRTYRSHPMVPEQNMTLGLPNTSGAASKQNLFALLIFPFRRSP